MTILHKIAITLAFTLLPASGAFAQWYVGGDGGVNVLTDSKISGQDNTSATIGSKTGYVLQMEGGYDFGGPKAELEVGYRNSGIKTLTDVNSAGGRTSSLSFMANAQYEFLPGEKWHPFIGAGIGMAQVTARWSEAGSNIVDDSDWVFAYQAFVGVGYDLSKAWQLKAQYRYFATEDVELASSDNNKFSAENENHAFMVGVTYRFGRKTASVAQAETATPTDAPLSYAAMDAQPRRLWLPGPRQPR